MIPVILHHVDQMQYAANKDQLLPVNAFKIILVILTLPADLSVLYIQTVHPIRPVKEINVWILALEHVESMQSVKLEITYQFASA